MIIYSLLYLLIGAAASFTVGLLGLGAGLVILPTLSLIFLHIFPASIALKVTVGTCVATFIPISLITARRYLKTHNVDLNILYKAAPGYLIGGILAPIIAHHIPSKQFHMLIGGFLIALSVLIFYRAYKAKRKEMITTIDNENLMPPQTKVAYKNPHWSTLIIASSLISIICGTAGVASGILMIPFLNKYLNYLHAVTISICGAVLYSTFTSISYMVVGWHAVANSPSIMQLGYIYLPAAIMIAIPAYWFAPFGVRCAQKTNTNILKMIFSCLVLIAGIDLFHH